MKLHCPTINAHQQVLKFLQSPEYSSKSSSSRRPIVFTMERDGLNRLISSHSTNRLRSTQTIKTSKQILTSLKISRSKPHIDMSVDISTTINPISSSNIEKSRLIKTSRNPETPATLNSLVRTEQFKRKILIKNDSSMEIKKPPLIHPAFNSKAHRFRNDGITDNPSVGSYNPNILNSSQQYYTFSHSKKDTVYEAANLSEINPQLVKKHLAIPNLEKMLSRNVDINMMKNELIWNKSSKFANAEEDLMRLQSMVEKYCPNYDEIKLITARAKQVHSIVMKVNAAPRLVSHKK